MSAITITPPTNLGAGFPFTLSGFLSGEVSKPVLKYCDDASLGQITGLKASSVTPTSIVLTWNLLSIPFVTLPANANVTTTDFSFIHPPLSSGPHTTLITDGNTQASITYNVPVLPDTAQARISVLQLAVKCWILNPIPDLVIGRVTFPTPAVSAMMTSKSSQAQTIVNAVTTDINAAVAAANRIANRTTRNAILQALNDATTQISLLKPLLP